MQVIFVNDKTDSHSFWFPATNARVILHRIDDCVHVHKTENIKILKKKNTVRCKSLGGGKKTHWQLLSTVRN